MSATESPARANVRYEPNDPLPAPLALGLGMQFAVLCLAGIVLTPAIVIRAGGGSEAYLSWAVFAAVAVSGITTILQSVRLGRLGSGYILVMGTSATFIAVCIAAIARGGPGLLATLVVVSSLFQFLLSGRLSLLRRILTPAVSGTVIMLIAVTVMPVAFDMLKEAPGNAPSLAVALSAAVTLAAMVAIALRGNAVLRLWAPLIGVAAGSVVAGLFGLYDTGRVAQASWFGLPHGDWPGMNFDFGPLFWSLLPAFVFATLVGAIETIGDGLAIQRVSWRKPRAPDFRAVQGAVAADGVGNLLSGLAGTVPNTTYSSSVSVAELTGVAARRVGIWVGALFLAVAFLPKTLALILAVPAPVVAAYIIVLMSMLFIVGVKLVFQDGMNSRNSLICGVSFWVGAGFQAGAIFPEYFSTFAGGMLENGMTAGGLSAVLMTLFVELTAPRRRRLEAEFNVSALPAIQKFLESFARHRGFGSAMANRMQAASEETLLTLLEQQSGEAPAKKRLLLVAHKSGDGAVLELIAAPGDGNVEDRIALLAEQGSRQAPEQEVSLRLLHGLASSVRHQQYHDTDIVTVRVDAPRPGAGAES